MSMDKREIEGSPERAADRGRAEDLGWPAGDRPSLGNPDVVIGLVRAFGAAVVDVRKRYNLDELTHDGALAAIDKLSGQYGDIAMGRDPAYEALPWNSPEQLGANIHKRLPEANEDPDPGKALFLALARSLLDVAVAHEDGDMKDGEAQGHIEAAISSIANLIVGVR